MKTTAAVPNLILQVLPVGLAACFAVAAGTAMRRAALLIATAIGRAASAATSASAWSSPSNDKVCSIHLKLTASAPSAEAVLLFPAAPPFATSQMTRSDDAHH